MPKIKETNDPSEILEEGSILPFGGHQGSSHRHVIEMTAAGFTGAEFSYQVAAEAPESVSTFRTG